MTFPALARLRERFPESRISILAHSKLVDLWHLLPFIDSVITFDSSDSVRSVARRLRNERFDVGLTFPNSWRTALELWFASIPIRVGYAKDGRGILLTDAITNSASKRTSSRKRSIREIRRLVSQTERIRPSDQSQPLHQAHQYLNLVGRLGANPKPVSVRLAAPETIKKAFLDRFDLATSPAPLFGLNPGAEYGPAKRWPSEKYIEAAHEIQKHTGCTWLIFGSSNDIPIARRIEEGLRQLAKSESPSTQSSTSTGVLNLAGKTSLNELLAGLNLSRLLLTNDTGSMHCAGALGTPVIAVFGSTSPELTGPPGIDQDRGRILRTDVPCAPCFRRVCPIDSRCMNIAVPHVVQAVIETIQKE